MRSRSIPILVNDVLKAWQLGPEIFKFEWSRTPWAWVVREKERAVVRVGGRQGMKGACTKSEVPLLVTESTVETYKGGAAPFIAPSEFSVLKADLLQLAVVDCTSETRHKANVEVAVVFITCFVDQVEIPDDEPSRVVRRFQTPHVEKEGFLIHPPGGAIDCGKKETRHAVS
jgi:hypothetical protein